MLLEFVSSGRSRGGTRGAGRWRSWRRRFASKPRVHPPPGSRTALLRGPRLHATRILPDRKLPLGPDEMAGVAVRDSFEVVLMFGLGLPEWTGGGDFGHDLSRPQARRVDIGDRVFGDPLLLAAGVEDRRSIAEAPVIALAIAR